MAKKEIKIGDRISELIKEHGILKSHFAVEMHVTPQAVSAWLSNKSMPSDDTIKNIAAYFKVYPEYLTGEIDYKNFEDFKNHVNIEIELRDFTKHNFLHSWGYTFKQSQYFKKNDNYYNCKNKPLDDSDNDFVFEVTTPTGETRYIASSELDLLIDDFFYMLKKRLLDSDISSLWDMNKE